ncbi:glycosyltransferase family 4 protein [uncultured Jannaschia sp.]|uniref:glycosyltransferase family 4 protein n=1 Tax=uncultured Jannaschia sp. TaxID=293347 RepID=UPI00262F84C9|nr:glycosyltransferase family 4 protein [uncultured Jannaschia sp.]
MRAVFAIPGDMDRRTGGFIYEATVLRTLRALGHDIAHLRLPDGFPDPTPAEVAETLHLLGRVPADVPVLLDGFVPGTVDPGGLARLAAPLVPIIHHPLGLETGLAPDRAAFLRANEAASLRHAARIVVPSPHTARILSTEFGVPAARIAVAPPGFEMPEGPRRPATPPLILSVGLLAERKGHDVLVAALARIADLDWQARIVGAVHDPAVADALVAQVRAAGLSDRIGFAGELDTAALRGVWAQASIFALATRYEGYGIAFGEAMGWGLPIVSCAAGAVPDTVGEAGLLVPPGDPDAFAGALRRLLTDAATRDAFSAASARAGAALPRWSDTAREVAAAVRDAAPGPR